VPQVKAPLEQVHVKSQHTVLELPLLLQNCWTCIPDTRWIFYPTLSPSAAVLASGYHSFGCIFITQLYREPGHRMGKENNGRSFEDRLL